MKIIYCYLVDFLFIFYLNCVVDLIYLPQNFYVSLREIFFSCDVTFLQTHLYRRLLSMYYKDQFYDTPYVMQLHCVFNM